MDTSTERHLKTGSDPRLLPDYAALREELGKLTHPARPDVDWRRVEQLSLSLFERNGVELQTAAWYTQARLRLLGLPGLNEGLAILEALISRQWGNLWPQPVHARMEILSGLSQRVQQTLRTFSLRYADLGALYQAEQHLTRIITVLERLELKHVSQMDALRLHLQNAAARLENDAGQSEVTLKERAVTVNDPQTDDDIRRVYVPDSVPAPDVASAHMLTRRSLKPFIAEMLTMLVAGSAVLMGWQAYHRPNPVQARIAASLRAWPQMADSATITPEQARQIDPALVLTQTRQRLGWLATLPPDRNIRFACELVRQASQLLPQHAQAQALTREWRQQMSAAALPLQNLDGWRRGMTQLDELTARLNALDERRGKYLTGSELKTMVFNIHQAFAAMPPAEELLRQMAEQRQQGVEPGALRQETATRLNQLLYRYVLLTPPSPDAATP
ncbi:type VI secretion system ImpA family N-terminal domain-containing protein [Cronobacter sakazakii]|nr:type VI secretion system ImpA family N-terminal domain-containing protein [Cronobacter sakazakii]EJC1156079.1 type VI secretion system ImpA family N-terminal domain-containing protein [Cronobacter sakazakii]EJC1181823.1 type VI secretion system ImpA family N-terminal domain-containing protein [Cronobacter sakazakii]EJC1184678.1 type VI secretion system ImpA family N-terminal domain-containing protein [Cronobacter sakazakii]EJC1241879.1 type VI secretion system ImpA family N-terminal domain-c